MGKEKRDWIKFTIRLEPETVHLMHKYCKEPTPILRELIKSWVKEITRKGLEEEARRMAAGKDLKWEDTKNG